MNDFLAGHGVERAGLCHADTYITSVPIAIRRDGMVRAMREGLPEALPIALDTRMLTTSGTGVSTYARALREALHAVAPHPCIVTASETPGGAVRRALAATLPGRQRLVSQGTGMDGFTALAAPDLFRRSHVHFSIHKRLLRVLPPFANGIMHWTYPVPIVIEGWWNIYTIHDAIPLLKGELSPINPRRHRAVVAAIAAVASRIVTVSAASRNDVSGAFGIAAERIVNCGQPVSVHRPTSPTPLPAGLVPGAYFLFCGTIEPRKNLERLIEAHRASGTGLPLVLVGPDGWRSTPILERASRAAKVLRLGYQEREALVALMANARALVFPSLAEGFGLPVAEAMALGTPVVTSSCGALAEITNGAAMLVDPKDVPAIADAIARIARDDELASQLSRAGALRARTMSPGGFATRLRDLYTAVVAEPVIGRL